MARALTVQRDGSVMYHGEEIGEVAQREDKRWIAEGGGYATQGNRSRIRAARALAAAFQRGDATLGRKKAKKAKRYVAKKAKKAATPKAPRRPKARTSRTPDEDEKQWPWGGVRHRGPKKGRTGSIVLFDDDGDRIGSIHAKYIPESATKKAYKVWVARSAEGENLGTKSSRRLARSTVARAAGHRNCYEE